MSKQKGTYYENRLIKLFTNLGYESWRVPLSGALGENKLVKVPDRVRKYLIGDVCVNILGKDYPVEVKYREDAQGFRSLFTVHLLNSYRTYRPSGKYSYKVFREITDLLQHLEGVKQHQIVSNNKFPQQVIDWMDQVDILALKAKDEDWLFVVKKEI